MEPVEEPLHRTFTCVLLNTNAGGCVIVAEAVLVQLLASVTVTVYVPAARPVRSCVVMPPVQKYVYGETPPLTVRSMEPVEEPLHNTFTCVVLKAKAGGCVIVTAVVAVQPLLSVTVTVYVPAAKPLISCVVALFDHA